MNPRDEALYNALVELNILRYTLEWLMGRIAKDSDDPAAFLKEASEKISEKITKALPPEQASTVQEGLDRLLAEALQRARSP